MNLDWYKGIETLLNIDPIFSTDHVTAYYQKSLKSSISSSPIASIVPKAEKNKAVIIHNGIVKFLPAQTTKPHKCKYHNTYTVIKIIKSQFKSMWTHNINTSSKLELYCQFKLNFRKEPYLDLISDYFDRANLSRIRISSHHLEIELGRRKNVDRSDRICKWCNISLGINIIENETHFVNQCDLYAANRRITINKISQFHGNFNTNKNIDLISIIHSVTSDSNDTCQLQHDEKCEIVRYISRFISIALRHRKKFLKQHR